MPARERPVGRVFFVTSNRQKVAELREIASLYKVAVRVHSYKVHEVQTEDTHDLIVDKALKGFQAIRMPLIVDHASLRMECLGGLPGTLTQLFWKRVGGARLCRIAELLDDNRAEAVATLAYCDGQSTHVHERTVQGTIAPAPRGRRKFQWDEIFIPEGHTRTYSQMAITEKNAISQRRAALDALFAQHFNSGRSSA